MSATHDERPTFGTYWRRIEDVPMTKSLRFVQSDPSKPNCKGNTEESEQLAKNKRRAQVRKAQIQHRARKANYTKQLEADIAAIQEQIEDVERDRRTLRTENQAIRAQLSRPRQPAAADYGQATGDSSFYTTCTSFPQDATMSHWFDINSSGLDSFDVAGVHLTDMLGATSMCYDDGSPAYASSSRGSSGIYSTPQYMGSGDNILYPPYSEANSLDQSRQVIEYMPGFS